VAVYPLRGVDNPAIIADALVGHQAPRQLPAGEVVLAEITDDTVSTLHETAATLRERRRDVHPCLVGIPDDMEQARDVAESYAKTVVIDDDQREWIPNLVPYLPALFHESTVEETGIGSARLIRVDVSECPPDAGVLVPDLRARNGRPLHSVAEKPEVFAFTAPQAYHDIIHAAFAPRGSIVGHGTVTRDWITVVGFTFDEPAQHGATTGNTETSWASGLPRPPTDDTASRTNPLVAQITHSVLEEMAAHTVSTPDTEVYGTIYADGNDRVCHYHPIESEDHVLRTESSVRFMDEFTDHLRTLARLYEGIGCRLCGDMHSHPSGSTKQSDADKSTADRVWRTARNTCLVVGVADEAGPVEWEVVDGEAWKQLGECCVRIKAYSGAGGTKDIEVIGTNRSSTESDTGARERVATDSETGNVDHAFCP
jgi:proteasome lid subunit RPN8/RPN11